jgi:hypothetical protein
MPSASFCPANKILLASEKEERKAEALIPFSANISLLTCAMRREDDGGGYQKNGR